MLLQGQHKTKIKARVLFVKHQENTTSDAHDVVRLLIEHEGEGSPRKHLEIRDIYRRSLLATLIKVLE